MIGDDRIKSRIAGRKHASEVLLLGEDNQPSPEFSIAWQLIRDEATTALNRLGVAEAMEIVEEIESLASQMPDAGQELAENILEKSKSIGGTIERTNSVSDRQMSALENMRDGLAKWIRD